MHADGKQARLEYLEFAADLTAKVLLAGQRRGRRPGT